MLGFQYLQGDTVSSLTGFDLCYVYIAVMGLLYGQRQALIAVLFSVLIFARRMLVLDSTLLTLLYLPQHLIHLVSYAFVGMVTAYFGKKKTLSWRRPSGRKSTTRRSMPFYGICLKKMSR